MDEKFNDSKQKSPGMYPNESSMNEREYNAIYRAYPEQYINTFSSTVIMLIKLLEGCVAGFLLYHVFIAIVPFFRELSKEALEIDHALLLFRAEFGLSLSKELNDLLSQLAVGGLVLPYIVWIGTMLIIILSLLLVVIEAFALLEIRIAKKGAGIVKVIHQIYMWINVGALILLGVSVYQYYRYYKQLYTSSLAYYSTTVFWAVTGTACSISFITFLLRMLYHKDIAIAMKTVVYDLDTGKQGDFRRTHLPGISILFSSPFVVFFIVAVIGIIWNLIHDGGSIEEILRFASRKEILSVAFSAFSMIKYLCIPVCYRNLECSRGMRGEYSEKSGHFFRNLIIVLLVAAMMCFAVSKGLFKTIIDKFNGRRNNTQITAVLQTEEESKRQSELQSVNAVVENNDTPKLEETSNASGVSADFKEYMDSYEDFMNQYCDFMGSYNKSDTTLLIEYTSLMAKYAEFSSKIDNYDETNLSTEDYKYYMDVMNRVNKRLIEIPDKTE